MDDQSSSGTTRVDFDITVPAYKSNELQVRLSWGQIELDANWVVDESWTVTETFPANTENLLTVIFSDGNGATTLGSVEKIFRTGTASSQVLQISANEFDIQKWDSNNNGVPNLTELIAGTNVDGNTTPSPVEVNLALESIKTFRFTWQPSSNTDYYRVLENPDGVSGFTDISGELNASSIDFDHIVPLYERTNAEYIVQSCNQYGCVDSDTVLVSGTLDSAIGYIKASNTDVRDAFGGSLVLSADGKTLAVGAAGESSTIVGANADQNDNSSSGIGAVYVFASINGVWQQQAYLKADRHTQRDRFGDALGISDNGNVLSVGASGFSAETGEAFIFKRDNGAWTQSAALKASNAEGGDIFGNAIAISGDGKTVAVGAFGEDGSSSGINGDEQDNTYWRAGAVYVFVEQNGIWQQQAYVKQSNPDTISSNDEASDSFGRHAISLSTDGNTMAVGAPGEDSAATGINGDGEDNSLFLSGAVYVYIRSSDTWEQQAYIKPSNPSRLHQFGNSVSLSADGNTMAVNANGVDTIGDNSDFAGAVYIFNRTDDVWQERHIVQGSNTELEDRFGGIVSLSDKGDLLAISTAQEDSSSTGINGEDNNVSVGSGAAYVFKLNSGMWQEIAYIKATNTEKYDSFGASISLSGDGSTLAIGAPSERSAGTGFNADASDNSIVGAGAVYLY